MAPCAEPAVGAIPLALVITINCRNYTQDRR